MNDSASLILTPLQGWVISIIEQSGNTGKRVCELCEKTKREKEPETAPETPLPRKSGIYDLLPEQGFIVSN